MKVLLSTFAILLICFSCDPGHFGKIVIQNETGYQLELKYTTNLKDTTINMQPKTSVNILNFGGLGAGQDYQCCICEFNEIAILPSDTTKTITKSISDAGNWKLINANEKRYSTKEIICEFVILESDIQ